MATDSTAPAFPVGELYPYRAADAAWDFDYLTLFIAHNGEDAPAHALTAALMRDALPTPAERRAKRAVQRDRYAMSHHGVDWHALTGKPA